jgi:hypothetical protein
MQVARRTAAAWIAKEALATGRTWRTQWPRTDCSTGEDATAQLTSLPPAPDLLAGG